MTKEISEEAKKAIADLGRRKAIDRLQRDGCCSMDAVRRRVLALAAERNIPPAEYAKLMYKRVSTPHALAFSEKHKVSLDWLLYGDLKGLHRMTQWAKAEPAVTIMTAEKVGEVYLQLTPEAQQVISDKVRALVAKNLLNEQQEMGDD